MGNDHTHAHQLIKLTLKHTQGTQFPEAKKSYQQAIDLFKQEQHQFGEANALTGLGDLENRLANIDEARQYFQQDNEAKEVEQLLEQLNRPTFLKRIRAILTWSWWSGHITQIIYGLIITAIIGSFF